MTSAAPFRIESSDCGLSATRYGEAERAVLVFLPLAEERKGCVRPVHELGLACVAAGWSLITFDYAGTGESYGDFSDITWERLGSNCRD
ncbi:MAG: hypothetical protein JXR97_06235, partial [Planctomycetes bacterium]|nr:hypothetical protein [Planctomycetota bacterium]